MTKQKKHTVDYFPHQCNHGKTMFILEQRFGNDGYAFWFKLLECLGTADDQVLVLDNPVDWEFLQAKTHLSPESCRDVLDLLARLGAIDSELWDGRQVVWCEKFVNGIADVYRNRRVVIPSRPDNYTQKPRPDGVPTPRKPQSKVPDGVPTPRKPQSKVKESKVKETKEDTSSESGAEVIDFDQEFTERFWPMYPKKDCKKPALRAWTKARATTDLETIMAGLERYVAMLGRKPTGPNDFIPNAANPATWLNAERWNDELSEKKGDAGYANHRNNSRLSSGADATGSVYTAAIQRQQEARSAGLDMSDLSDIEELFGDDPVGG
jgi:hypothetical protein